MPPSACLSLHRDLHSFPTRRSSDLKRGSSLPGIGWALQRSCWCSCSVLDRRSRLPYRHRGPELRRARPNGPKSFSRACWRPPIRTRDRKSTRLNSSHLGNSYAALCLPLATSRSALFPYTTLFRSQARKFIARHWVGTATVMLVLLLGIGSAVAIAIQASRARIAARQAERTKEFLESMLATTDPHERSEEHTSELQSLRQLVCRPLPASRYIEICTLSLHDALPISSAEVHCQALGGHCNGHAGAPARYWIGGRDCHTGIAGPNCGAPGRTDQRVSREHAGDHRSAREIGRAHV